MNISLIAAVGKNYELGKDNKLIWTFKEDMKFFKNVTTGNMVVMGRKTFESLPCILSNRKNIVISRNNIINNRIEVYKNIKDFLTYYQKYEEEIFVIGGESIYKQFLSIASKIYLTEIEDADLKADTYFPRFNLDEWNKEIINDFQENNIRFKHVLYKRK